MTGLLPAIGALGLDGLWVMDVLVVASIYALLGLSLNLINGYGGMFSLGHHGFWAIGAYAAAWLTLQLDGTMPGVFVWVLSVLFAMGTAALGGLAIGLPCLRLRGDYLAIATLGFGEIVRIAVQNTPALGGSIGLEVPRVLMTVDEGSRGQFRLLFLALSVVIVGLVAVAIRNLIRSGRGRAILAVAQDETAAALLGINPTRPKMTAFLLGAALAGLAGALFVHYQKTITPLDFGFMEMVKIFLVVVLGGLGSLSGCMLAAVLLYGAERILARTEGWLAEWWQVEYALLLVLLMIFRPRGLLGGREVHVVVRDLWRQVFPPREENAT